MRAKIVITDWGFPSLNPEREIFKRYGCTVEDHHCKTERDVTGVVRDADIVLTQWAPVGAAAIAAMEHCKGIVRYGIGLDNVDLKAARERGIPVRNVPDYCLDEVADHTMALILSLQRQVLAVDKLVRNGTWNITPPIALPPLRASTLGLIGFGRIAQRVAERARAFRMRIMAADPFVDDAVLLKLNVERKDVKEIFSEADIVSVHCPLADHTRHLVNAASLARMKPTALLVNTARGGLVNTEALLKALREGTLAGAALDVLEQEPIPQDDELLNLPNVIITSHTAWYSNQSAVELQRRAALAAVELLGLK